MAEEQGYNCAICEAPTSELRLLQVDHNHRTRQVRALVCHNCNHMRGLAHDSEAMLYKAIEYLRRYDNCEGTNREAQ